MDAFNTAFTRFSDRRIGIPEFVRKFKSLDTLVLDNLELDVDEEHYSIHFSLAWIPAVLRRLSSPIRKLKLEFSARDISQLDVVPWAFVDEVVADPLNTQFRSLNRVEVLVQRKGPSEDGSFLRHRDTLHQEFKSRLPEIERMGLLRCSFVSSSRVNLAKYASSAESLPPFFALG